MLTYNKLSCINAPLFLLNMDSILSVELTSNDILNCVNQYYRDIVLALHECSCSCIPRKKHGFYKYWWDEELTLLKESAIQSYNIWSAVGKPRFGVEFDNMKRDKLRYKLAIKQKERCNANSFSDSLNDALSSKDVNSFCKIWRSKFGNNRLPSVIDDCCNEVDIANRFAEV